MNKKNPEKINAGILKEKEEQEKKQVLEGLALEISKKFKIEKKEAIKLIKSSTLESLDNLKNEIETNPNLKGLDTKDIENLFLTLKGAKEIIENYSKIKIEVLKNDIENNKELIQINNKLENYLPKKLIENAKNPKSVHEHILGIALGSANTIVAVVDVLYQIGAGIIQMPYHIYLIISGKGEIEGTDEI